MVIASGTAAAQTSMNIGILMMNAGRGSGVVARQHANDLVSHGHNVTIMHPGMEDGDHVAGAENICISLKGMPTPVHEGLPRAGDSQKPVSAMTYNEAAEYIPIYEEALAKIAPNLDLIIGHHGNLSAVAVQKVAEKFGKPYTLFLHGTGVEPRFGYHGPNKYDDRIWDLIETSIMAAAGIMVTAEYVRDELVQKVLGLNGKQLPMDRFFVLPIGVDLAEFNASNVGDIKAKYNLPETYVICPGALSKLKGPMDVAVASRQYSDLAHTVFTGGGPLKDDLTKELGDRGVLLGFVSNEDKAQLINGATLLVASPFKKEHFGIIYTEALGGSTPIVAYEGGGVNSIVSKDVGVLTERSPEILGATIRKVLEDKVALAGMAKAARIRAEDLFDGTKLGAKLNDWVMQWTP